MKHLLRFLPVLLVPALASASSVWKGDFETGDISQWDRKQTVAADRLQVQTAIVREGKYALKTTVRQGDDPINASGNRNELLYMSLEPAGTELYYKWSTYFPASFPRSSTWQVFAQWHHMGPNGSPPLEFFIIDDEMRMRAGGVSGPIVWRAPLERDRWHDFVLRVKWSPNAKVGFVELYKDGKLAVPKRFVATQFSGDVNYLKLGLYRNDSISQVGVVYHDGFEVATTLEDVMPAPQPAPEEPEPVIVAEPTPEPTPTEQPSTEQPSTEQPSNEQPEPSMPSEVEPGPVLTAPSDSAPTYTPEPDNTVLPGGDTGSPTDGQDLGRGPSGCGASATGGMPVMAAVLALVAVMLVRRRRALAPARARSSKR